MRKFASTPATRLKSSRLPEAWRDSTMAPMSESSNTSRRTRATV